MIKSLNYGTGVIRSSNYRQGVSGFTINHDGNAEFYNGTFRGRLEANSGFYRGLLRIGNTWNDDATINDLNAGSSLLAHGIGHGSPPSAHRLMVKDLACYGVTGLGMTLGNMPGSTEIYGRRYADGPFRVHGSRFISGNYTAASLYSMFADRLAGEDVSFGDISHPINGAISIAVSDGDGGSRTTIYHITTVFIRADSYEIRGISSAGQTFTIFVYSNRIAINGVTITGSITADFVFL